MRAFFAYWCRVERRAMRDTLELFNLRKPARVALNIGLPLLAVLVAAWLLGAGAAATRGQQLLVGLVCIAVAFVVVLTIQMIGTPHRLDAELSAERDTIRQRLEKWQNTEAAGRRLEALWKRGAALRDARDRDNPDWKARVIWWFRVVDNDERDSLPPHEQFGLETMPLPDGNESATVIWQKLEQKLAAVRSAASRFLSPPV